MFVKLPFNVLRILSLNIANMVAPEVTYKVMHSQMKKNEDLLEISKNFKSTKDMGFWFSFDQVNLIPIFPF